MYAVMTDQWKIEEASTMSNEGSITTLNRQSLEMKVPSLENKLKASGNQEKLDGLRQLREGMRPD